MLQATFDAALLSHATELKGSAERSDALLEEIDQECLKGKQLTGELETMQVNMHACLLCLHSPQSSKDIISRGDVMLSVQGKI